MKASSINVPNYFDISWLSKKSRSKFLEAVDSYTEKRFWAKWKIDEGKTREQIFADVETRMFSMWNTATDTLESNFDDDDKFYREQEKLSSLNQDMRKSVLDQLDKYRIGGI